jgi:starch synthase (maltosyl-transferring)
LKKGRSTVVSNDSAKSLPIPAKEKYRNRIQISGVQPEIDGGRYPVKRVIDDRLTIEADIVVDGHNALSASLLYRKEQESHWHEVPMAFLENDRWRGQCVVTRLGRWQYTIQAWIDEFKSWQRDMKKRVQAGQIDDIDLLIGLNLIKKAQESASPADAEALARCIETLTNKRNVAEAIRVALSDELSGLMARNPDKKSTTWYGKELEIVVDPKLARFSTWYELFPRSCSPRPGKHGTFADVINRLQYIADMGFDVLYLPPIHPIGTTQRKGKNNTVNPQPNDVGSPWAIGNGKGGHKSTHPELGSLVEFRKLVTAAENYGIAIALDLAYQCSPDHPYVKEHPEWFRKRPDNTIQYAENPPKKYQDIYPIEFENPTWDSMWEELKSIVEFWIKQGVHVFRVDNPHTKDFSFWEWMIASVKRQHPEVIFLSEAFTRPKIMYQLAKLGFSQSYTYFAWRNSKWELTEYFTELTQTQVKEYFRPNLWPNTPDILTEYLQVGGPDAFKVRLILAATLGASYGIYGPAFELCESEPLEINSEEYLDSEKYEIRNWDLDSPGSLQPFIAQVNRIRNQNIVLQSDSNLRFYPIDNDAILCYGKHDDDFSEILIVAVNLDPNWPQSGWLELPLDEFGLSPEHPYQVHDLMDGKRYLWNGSRNFMQLDPATSPAHIFRLRRLQRSERNFDYYF